MTPSQIPRAVLSEHFQERLDGRRLLGAVFLTYRFDPAFFEQDILPIFLDIPVSHAPAIRLVQLEDALRELPHGVAVYYDSNGLVTDGGSAKLDVSRVAVCHRRGVFHPKNILALVEAVEPDEDGHRPQTLIVACLSANLTRDGWWNNVEVCHCEEIGEGDRTRLKDDLRRFLSGIGRRVGGKVAGDRTTVQAIKGFLSRTEQRVSRRRRGQVLAHLYDGSQSVLDFIEGVAGKQVRGMNLEIISPYFDASPHQLPLESMCDRLQPREVRVFLPMDPTGEAACTAAVLEHVRSLRNTSWGTLPADLVKSGKGEKAQDRRVHAKVYRFFNRNERREILFIGSVNLTSAAHQGSVNLESGFLIEVEGASRADWWMTPDNRRTITCKPPSEDEDSSLMGGTPLSLRYSWHSGESGVYWDAQHPSPALRVLCHGVALFDLLPLSPGTWHALGSEDSAAIRGQLLSTSLFTVEPEGGAPGLLLVQEEGMHARPSLIRDLTPSEILRYWSLLTPTQRADFLSTKATELAASEEGAALIARLERLEGGTTFFDRFGGIFIAFATLEASIEEALQNRKKSHASYRLFGAKHDSLPNLLRMVGTDAQAGKGDIAEQYVTFLCAEQMVRQLRASHREFFEEYPREAAQLKEQLQGMDSVREMLIATSPGMSEFLAWFDQWFLKRAVPAEAEPV